MTEQWPTARLADLFNELPLPSGKALRWLLAEDVPFDSLYEVRGAWVRFYRDGGFELDADGDPALIFRCTDCGDDVIDLAAWSASEGKLASWLGVAFCIGDLDQCFNPAAQFGDGLHVHINPMGWLRVGGDGIVVLRPELAWTYLRNVPRLICETTEQGDQVKRWLKPPAAEAQIFVETPNTGLAA
jgi:hypothetical protein